MFKMGSEPRLPGGDSGPTRGTSGREGDTCPGKDGRNLADKCPLRPARDHRACTWPRDPVGPLHVCEPRCLPPNSPSALRIMHGRLHCSRIQAITHTVGMANGAVLGSGAWARGPSTARGASDRERWAGERIGNQGQSGFIVFLLSKTLSCYYYLLIFLA